MAGPPSSARCSPDIVRTWAEVEPDAPQPLVVLEGLQQYVPGSGPIEVGRIGNGHSNETFEVRRSGRPFVLRRPPRPPIAPTAHDVVRESRILEALAHGPVRAPQPVAVCADPAPIGAPFLLMEMVPGFVVRESMPAELEDPESRHAVVAEFVSALVGVHAVDWRGTDLERIGRPGGYLERQLRRWDGQWEHNATRAVPAIESIAEWLRERLPGSEEITLVHGDAKLDNAIYDVGPPVRLLALVDWEMSTLGDPLADLGLLCGTYVEPGEEPDPVLGFSAATAAAGAPRREEIAAWYAERSGRDVTALPWYELLAVWKILILLEGSYRRFLLGTTDDPFFARLEAGIPRVAARWLARAETLA